MSIWKTLKKKYTENLFCCPNQNELNSKYVVNEILSLKVWKRTYFYKQSISSKEKCFFNLISQEVSFPVLSKSILFKIELEIEQFIRYIPTQELHKYTTHTYKLRYKTFQWGEMHKYKSVSILTWSRYSLCLLWGKLILLWIQI